MCSLPGVASMRETMVLIRNPCICSVKYNLLYINDTVFLMSTPGITFHKEINSVVPWRKSFLHLTIMFLCF